MAFDVEGLLNLWTVPFGDDADAETAVRRFYTDPVRVNGAVVTARDLVLRTRALQATFGDVRREVLDLVETADKVAVAFRLSGRQVGPFGTQLGPVPPTYAQLTMRVIDILTLRNGLISEIVMVADELGALTSVGAAALVPTSEAHDQVDGTGA
jgi:hypothetical protein